MTDLSNWAGAKRPAPNSLSGQYTRLERLDWARHGDGLFAAVCGADNHDLWAYMPIGPFPDAAAFKKTFEWVRTEHDWHTLVILRGKTIAGMSSYMRLREAHGSAEVGCVAFGAQLKRTREATEAMYLMAAHLLDELGYRRYEWKCDNANAASRRAAERLGFKFEGIFRNDMVVKGKTRDTAWYAMTDADWPRIKTGFKAWLSPYNFDASGQQIKRLEALRA